MLGTDSIIRDMHEVNTKIRLAQNTFLSSFMMHVDGVDRLTFLCWVLLRFSEIQLEDSGIHGTVRLIVNDENMDSHVIYTASGVKIPRFPDRNNSIRRLQRADNITMYSNEEGEIVIDCTVKGVWIKTE